MSTDNDELLDDLFPSEEDEDQDPIEDKKPDAKADEPPEKEEKKEEPKPVAKPLAKSNPEADAVTMEASFEALRTFEKMRSDIKSELGDYLDESDIETVMAKVEAQGPRTFAFHYNARNHIAEAKSMISDKFMTGKIKAGDKVKRESTNVGGGPARKGTGKTFGDELKEKFAIGDAADRQKFSDWVDKQKKGVA